MTRDMQPRRCASRLLAAGLALFAHALPGLASAQDAGKVGDPYWVDIDGTEYSLSTVHPLGVIPDDPALIARKQLQSKLQSFIPVPASVDMTDKLPPPGDQGWQGSCVGWAVGYATKSFDEVVEEGWSPATSSTQFSPAWVYNQINGGVDGGSQPADAMDLIVNHGADTLAFFPYDPSDYTTQPDAASFARAAHYKADSWNTINVSEDDFKLALAFGLPIVIAMAVLPDFDALNGTTNTVYDTAHGTTSSCSTEPCIRGYHAIAIIGYDDAQHAFKFINSWGTGFNLGGYGWIDYSFIKDPWLGMSAYVLHDGTNSPYATNPGPFDASVRMTWLQSTMSLH